jgi:hypothetical protein
MYAYPVAQQDYHSSGSSESVSRKSLSIAGMVRSGITLRSADRRAQHGGGGGGLLLLSPRTHRAGAGAAWLKEIIYIDQSSH